MVKKTSARKYIPDEGDILMLDLSPTRGHEQSGSRPVVVLSFAKFNRLSGLCTVVPITSVVKGYGNEVRIDTDKIRGVALIDQIRTIDFEKRVFHKEGSASHDQLAEIRAKSGTLLGIL